MLRCLDLDHSSSEITEHHARVWTSQSTRQVDDDDVTQWAFCHTGSLTAAARAWPAPKVIQRGAGSPTGEAGIARAAIEERGLGRARVAKLTAQPARRRLVHADSPSLGPSTITTP